MGDVVVAFAAGSPSPSGTVLISGTGVIATKTIAHAPVALAPEVPVAVAGDGAGAAAWLALRELVPPAEAARLHARLASTGR
ncbi:hypothetical protein IMZ11_12090 [Microtetraspora sp. AC03309]|uniref:hypothetical protein n=1 Tax=Microtetraspora sp. AC03309 TaxID=2779376 RepID=UPI001E4C6B25|nr:hypothetical protein [Microtetraspora sp. AC03309]MCC5576372.1 hypothetical protein [Microtetraspora sp. AC03309]